MPWSLESIVRKCLLPDPAQRYQQASHLAVDLRRFLENQPLRYAGKAFYQASFGKNDTLSILQVVENPGWLLPYASCLLVAGGLLLHFALGLRRSAARQKAAALEA